jgi:hypothetical protein
MNRIPESMYLLSHFQNSRFVAILMTQTAKAPVIESSTGDFSPLRTKETSINRYFFYSGIQPVIFESGFVG